MVRLSEIVKNKGAKKVEKAAKPLEPPKKKKRIDFTEALEKKKPIKFSLAPEESHPVGLSEALEKKKPNGISEAPEKKERSRSYSKLEHIYSEMLNSLKSIMHDLKEGKTIDALAINTIAEKIITEFSENKDVLFIINGTPDVYLIDDLQYLFEHSLNVSIYAVQIGLIIGYNRSQLLDLCASSLLHDIGYLKIPIEILNKPGKLTDSEFQEIKKHPILGLEMLAHIENSPNSLFEVVYQHHERVDGSGYPKGKKGDEINTFAKIISMIDVYEAVTHNRPHRDKTFNLSEGIKLVILEGKKTFDPHITKFLLEYFTPFPLGSYVSLNSGEIGHVIMTNPKSPLRPKIEIEKDINGKFLEDKKIIDLSKSPILFIKKVLDTHVV